MGETDVHRKQNTDLIEALDAYYRNRADVYVSGNLLLLYEEGHPRKHRSPDVLVTLGIEKRQRLHYRLWVEGKAPDFIIEVTSKSTRTEDTVVKKRLYARIGVREFFIFDPLREYQDPGLRGFRLAGGLWVPILAGRGQTVRSEVLGLELQVVDNALRIVDPSGKLLPTPGESDVARREAELALEKTRAVLDEKEAALQAKEAALQAAEAARKRDSGRLMELEAELKRLRGEG